MKILVEGSYLEGTKLEIAFARFIATALAAVLGIDRKPFGSLFYVYHVSYARNLEPNTREWSEWPAGKKIYFSWCWRGKIFAIYI